MKKIKSGLNEDGITYCYYSDYEKLEEAHRQQEKYAENLNFRIEKLETENRHLRAKLKGEEALSKLLDANGQSYRLQITELEKKLTEAESHQINIFTEDQYPMYGQGAPNHELLELVTADALNHGVEFVKNLETRLAEAEKALSDHKGALECHDRLQAVINEKEAELSRLRDVVPGEVERSLVELLGARARFTLCSIDRDEFEVYRSSFLTLIGSLITTERERVREMLKEAYINGAMLMTTPDFEQLAAESEAYVQKLRNLL